MRSIKLLKVFRRLCEGGVFVMFFMIIGYTGSSELEFLSNLEYIQKVAWCFLGIGLFLIARHISNYIEDEIRYLHGLPSIKEEEEYYDDEDDLYY